MKCLKCGYHSPTSIEFIDNGDGPYCTTCHLFRTSNPKRAMSAQEQFEKAMKERYVVLDVDSFELSNIPANTYKDTFVENHWRGWQMGREK